MKMSSVGVSTSILAVTMSGATLFSPATKWNQRSGEGGGGQVYYVVRVNRLNTATGKPPIFSLFEGKFSLFSDPLDALFFRAIGGSSIDAMMINTTIDKIVITPGRPVLLIAVEKFRGHCWN